jgi:chromosome condensin MukBEF ATPase and DNA-binding subunit MukB
MASDSIATAMSTVNILITGWAIIATAAVALLFSKSTHLRHQLAKAITERAHLNDAYQRANQVIGEKNKQKTIIAEAYRSKDKECERLREEKSALNEFLNDICRRHNIKRMSDRDGIKVDITAPVCSCGSGKDRLRYRDGSLSLHCEDCIPL